MAFPSIPTVAGGRVLTSLNTTASTTQTFPNLSSLTKSSGDLLIAICCDGHSNSAASTEFSSWGGGFTEIVDVAGGIGSVPVGAAGVAYKFSTGSETGTFTVTSTASSQSGCVLLSISGAHASTAPSGTGFAGTAGNALEPPSHDPAGWATEDTLWIAVGVIVENTTAGSFTGVTAAPTNYTDFIETGITSDTIGGVDGGVAFRQLNAASEDPGAFTSDTSATDWVSATVAVRPGAGGTPGTANPSAILRPFTVPQASAVGTASSFVPPARVRRYRVGTMIGR